MKMLDFNFGQFYCNKAWMSSRIIFNKPIVLYLNATRIIDASPLFQKHLPYQAILLIETLRILPIFHKREFHPA